MACKNGSTEVNFLTSYAGRTETSAQYLLQLTHFTCGNKQMCLNNADGLPVVSNLNLQQVGAIQPLGNGTYCCDVRCICDLTYQQICGSSCCPNYCLQTEKCVATVCVPVLSTDPVTLTPNGASVTPVRISCRCNTTNTCSIDVSFMLEQTAATAAANPSVEDGRKK